MNFYQFESQLVLKKVGNEFIMSSNLRFSPGPVDFFCHKYWNKKNEHVSLWKEISPANHCLTKGSKRIQKDTSDPGLINGCAGKGEKHCFKRDEKRELNKRAANSPQACFSFSSLPLPSHTQQQWTRTSSSASQLPSSRAKSIQHAQARRNTFATSLGCRHWLLLLLGIFCE